MKIINNSERQGLQPFSEYPNYSELSHYYNFDLFGGSKMNQEEKKTWGFIYKFDIQNKIYIGQTAETKNTGLKKRFQRHFREKKYNTYFHNSLRKYFSSNNFCILESHYDTLKNLEKILNEREIFWIAKLETYDPEQKKGWNLTKGGGGCFGKKDTEITREKRRKSATDKHPSEITRQKMRENNLGEKNPWFGKKRPEHSKRMSGENHPMFGKKWTLKQFQRMSGGNHPNARPAILISPLNEEYKVLAFGPFCLKYNLNAGAISQVLQGKRKSHKGWTGRYLKNTK